MEIKIAPSVLAADFLHLEAELKRTEDAGAEWLHCDVMDGIYVPNMSFGFGIIGQMHTATRLPLDVHMMTAKPQNYIEELKKAGAYSVTFHTDVMDEEGTIETLKKIRSLGMRAAISVKPKQPAEEAFKFAKYCDMILVMTVEPGFGGQKFMADMLPKIKAIREYLDKNHPECE
ncbi:MAG: ribulose-phosphate 3-epimerase, partial [Clostridia bacterium]|nr:ribulose-phosphate 3-epimerase [Clostridia bacterium]